MTTKVALKVNPLTGVARLIDSDGCWLYGVDILEVGEKDGKGAITLTIKVELKETGETYGTKPIPKQ